MKSKEILVWFDEMAPFTRDVLGTILEIELRKREREVNRGAPLCSPVVLNGYVYDVVVK